MNKFLLNLFFHFFFIEQENAITNSNESTTTTTKTKSDETDEQEIRVELSEEEKIENKSLNALSQQEEILVKPVELKEEKEEEEKREEQPTKAPETSMKKSVVSNLKQLKPVQQTTPLKLQEKAKTTSVAAKSTLLTRKASNVGEAKTTSSLARHNSTREPAPAATTSGLVSSASSTAIAASNDPLINKSAENKQPPSIARKIAPTKVGKAKPSADQQPTEKPGKPPI